MTSLERGAGKSRDAFVVEVAGVSVRVVSGDPSLRIAPGKASRAFLTPPREAGKEDLTLRVLAGDPSGLEKGISVFDSGGVWRLSVLRDGASCYRFHDVRSGELPYKTLRLDPDGTEGAIVLDSGSLPGPGPIDPLEFPLDELLFLTLLGRTGGLELHACGVRAPDGRGFLFAGHSGDGKTTMARLWEALPGAVVLSDDRIVVKEGPAGRWEMFGTPWHGEAELAANVRAEVAGIFVLGRGPRNRLGTMSRSEAVSALLARSFPPFHASDGMSRALELLDRLSLAARVERFEVRPGPEAVETVLTWGR